MNMFSVSVVTVSKEQLAERARLMRADMDRKEFECTFLSRLDASDGTVQERKLMAQSAADKQVFDGTMHISKDSDW